MNFLKNILIRLLRTTASHYYTGAKLSKSSAPSQPLILFTDWFELARQLDPERHNAMALSTATPEGRPSTRMVLLKDFNQDGFVFYTNYGSRKAAELESNPQASLLFWWKEAFRQIRIEGRVKRLDKKTSEAYFKSRARGSQIGAWASKQSSVLKCRTELEEKTDNLAKRFSSQEIPAPEFWGGYLLTPIVFEFWQARADRLHDRLRYNKGENDSWSLERLSP